MTKFEVENYVQMSSQGVICVHRERCQGAELIVKSIYITGKPGAYVVRIEFDPITMIEDGEGWVWHSVPKSIEDVVDLLVNHFQSPLEDWENVTKSGKLLHDHYDLNLSGYKEDEERFKSECLLGELYLPKGFDWINKNSITRV